MQEAQFEQSLKRFMADIRTMAEEAARKAALEALEASSQRRVSDEDFVPGAGDDGLTKQKVAELIGRDVRTVDNLVKKGVLTRCGRPEERPRYSKRQALAYLANRGTRHVTPEEATSRVAAILEKKGKR